MIRLALLTFALAAFVPAASAVMYKWVDEKGVTHYSENPPPDGKATQVDTRPTGPAASPEDWKQREMDARRRRLEKDIADENEKARAHNAAAGRLNHCNRAQREIKVLALQMPVYSRNERGEKVYLEDKDRDREIAEWRKQAETYCDSR